MRKKIDVLIVGGGPAGLAAAVKLFDLGIRDILIAEREEHLGGILRQCIHDGFGLTRFGESLSGPEYAARFILEVRKRGIPCLTGAAVTKITPDKRVSVVSREGLLQFEARAIVLAMGCRERTRGALAIPGERPAGVLTAGVAQAYINLYNRLPAREAVILGSGDIGMIMARRLTLEGCHVRGVYEVMPYPSGLPRNVLQCLEDYGIPLYLSTTVTDIHGESRLRGVTVQKVDAQRRPIEGTKEVIPCNTLILSVGLIPENELSREAGIGLDPRTGGALVDEWLHTGLDGVFAAGNVLHVHDLVDFVSMEAERLALGVQRYLSEGGPSGAAVPIRLGDGVSCIVPQRLCGQEEFTLSLRVSHPMRNVSLRVTQNGEEILAKKLAKALPAEMIQVKVAPRPEIAPLEVSVS